MPSRIFAITRFFLLPFLCLESCILVFVVVLRSLIVKYFALLLFFSSFCLSDLVARVFTIQILF